ncbi:HD domain-containing protein [Patescibacteria group bacterium]
MKFKNITTPDGKKYQIPEDITLIFPESKTVSQKDLHFLAYIPWNDKYFEHIPEEYKDFFQKILPKLSKRTTDVHTAICLGFLDELSQGEEINKKVLAISLILHDVGWDKLSDVEITSSLGVQGVLELSDEASKPKTKHAVEGEKISKEILNEYPLPDHEKELILKSVRLHDIPWEIKQNGETPKEVQLLADLDHLWSYTHQNFWQDTVRKGVEPQTYLENLEKDIDGYFITLKGKDKARQLLGQRRKEVDQLV